MRDLNSIIEITTKTEIDVRVQKTLKKEGLKDFYENWKYRTENTVNALSKLRQLHSEVKIDFESEFVSNKDKQRYINIVGNQIERDIITFVANGVHTLLKEFNSYYNFKQHVWGVNDEYKDFVKNKMIDKDFKWIGTDEMLHDIVYRYFEIGDIDNYKFEQFKKGLNKCSISKNRIEYKFATEWYSDDRYDNQDPFKVIEALTFFLNDNWGHTAMLCQHTEYNRKSQRFDYDINAGVYQTGFEELPKYRIYKNGKVVYYFDTPERAKEFFELWYE